MSEAPQELVHGVSSIQKQAALQGPNTARQSHSNRPKDHNFFEGPAPVEKRIGKGCVIRDRSPPRQRGTANLNTSGATSAGQLDSSAAISDTTNSGGGATSARGQVHHGPGAPDYMTRTMILERNIARMNDGVTEDVVLGPMDHSRPPVVGIRKPDANVKRDNNIFGPPKLNTPPKPRLRTGVTDEELTKIWQEDERKFRAAKQMEGGKPPVEQMYACEYPAKHKSDDIPVGKKPINRGEIANNGDAGVPGMRGMGRHHGNHEEKASGRRCDADADAKLHKEEAKRGRKPAHQIPQTRAKSYF